VRTTSARSFVKGGVFVFINQPKPIAPTSGEERRRSVRHAAVNQIAKIRLASGREELCLLKDISAEGVRAEVYVAIESGAAIDVELRTAHTATGRVAWTAGEEIGVAFDASIPTAAMLAHCSFDDSGGNLRPPRIRVAVRGLLRIGAAAQMANIANISLAGLQVEAPEPLRIGTACSIALPGLPARAASICWWREGNAGLMLVDPFDYTTFARWRAGKR
jgi:hypothetical protein